MSVTKTPNQYSTTVPSSGTFCLHRNVLESELSSSGALASVSHRVLDMWPVWPQNGISNFI